MNFQAKKDNLNEIILHENVRDVLGISLTDTANVPVRVNETNPTDRIREYTFLKINLADGVTLETEKEYKLRINYIGNINETPLQRGVFRGSYKDENGIRQ